MLPRSGHFRLAAKLWTRVTQWFPFLNPRGLASLSCKSLGQLGFVVLNDLVDEASRPYALSPAHGFPLGDGAFQMLVLYGSGFTS